MFEAMFESSVCQLSSHDRGYAGIHVLPDGIVAPVPFGEGRIYGVPLTGRTGWKVLPDRKIRLNDCDSLSVGDPPVE
jgi:hypothetical protein